ncbi:chemotaxis protein CheB [Acidovorax sp. SRB_14]|nr:chemotaxis protein CheB [Acidovorax sp. SRB_24]NMM79330.1 chemotaxis protein CheB [Acidovorax sp. SRB_14]NMM84581.1 chemotaxis protein CheB [Rhodococcus sp. SRB_17]
MIPRLPSDSAFKAIVIGGSAGSVEALGILLPALPATLRASLLVVLHLPRERPSLLCTIFQGRCALPLREAQDKEPIAPGTLYFAPPDYHLLVDTGPALALSVDAPVHYSRPSIDVLFESAADIYARQLIGIVLSGANEDGARGLAAVHGGGGLALVQAPASAPMRTMPEAALQRTAASQALEPQAIAALLTSLHLEGSL